MNIVTLPNDVFLLVTVHLSPRDLIVNRRVSKAFYASFTESELNRRLLVQHYPRALELRNVALDAPNDWAKLFASASRRYHYLKTGTPRSIEKLALGKSMVKPDWARNYPIAPWQRYIQYEGATAYFHYSDTLWTYEDGLLVFPSAEHQGYVLYDLNAGEFSRVVFEPEMKIVRRIRLCKKVLVVEWCEGEPYHQLNINEMVYRHFATAYDIVKDSEPGKWNTVFRNEWKIHFLGMALNSRDRFFSAHNANNYVLYRWQPNRSPYGEEEPIELLVIWDITSPSSYRPCQDPTSEGKPDESLEGARIIRHFAFPELDFYNIRQGATPILRGLEIDEKNVYFIEEDHRWMLGSQAGDILPGLHRVKTIGIPFSAGPRWEDECGADGDANLSFCGRNSDIRRPEIAPCWRHEEFPYLTITEARDAEAGVFFSARYCFRLETISINVKPRVRMTGPGYESTLGHNLWQQLLEKGKICGDERWLVGENRNQEVVILYFDRDINEMKWLKLLV